MSDKSELSALSEVSDKLDLAQARMFSSLLCAWTEQQAKRWEYRQSTAEPASLAFDDLRRFLSALSENGADDDGATGKVRAHAKTWSLVEGRDVMRVYLAESASGEDIEAFFAGLALAPNRYFLWRLVSPSFYASAAQDVHVLNMAAFRQMLWVQRYEFINDCVSAFGRPLPIMELAELCHGITDGDAFEAMVKHVLKPSELMFAIGHGVFQLNVSEPFESGFDEKNRVRMSLNPLFTRSR